MFLGQISYIDCFVFLIFLVPQLLIQVNIFKLACCILSAIPFFVLLPFRLISERLLTPRKHQSPFVRQASPFQDFVIRCVRYAFARFPAEIGRVFFSRPVALPFLRWRMLRFGYLHSPVQWKDVDLGITHGVHVAFEPEKTPDLIIYYCHGGGFSMGSVYFYLEFLIAWVGLLKEAGYQNPTIFGLEYSLVPDAAFPTQLDQTVAGYEYVCSLVNNQSRVCVGGDSAGATLILSMLLYNAERPDHSKRKPAFAALISPWTTLFSSQNRNTASDYLNAQSLHLYGTQYAGSVENLENPLVSPGVCKDGGWWANASPTAGFGVVYGSEEVLGPELRDLMTLLRKNGCGVSVREEPGSIHAWPIVTMFLSDTKGERQKGLKDLTKMVKQAISI